MDPKVVLETWVRLLELVPSELHLANHREISRTHTNVNEANCPVSVRCRYPHQVAVRQLGKNTADYGLICYLVHQNLVLHRMGGLFPSNDSVQTGTFNLGN